VHQSVIIMVRALKPVPREMNRNAELNGNQNPEWWGDFIQLVKIEKIKSLGISRYKVE